MTETIVPNLPPLQSADYPDENGILYAYALDGKGGAQPLEGASVSELIRDEKLAWVHMDANHKRARGWLQREVSYLDPLILDALLADETRPRMVEFEKGILLILRGVNLNENAEPHDMVSIRLWIDPSRIISLRRRKLSSVRDIRARLEEGSGPKDAGDFLSQLCARLFERMEPTLTALDESTDDIEEHILENPDAAFRQQIVDVRKQAILLRRYIAPQKDVISYLRTSEQEWITPQNRRQLQESFDRLTRYVEDLDAIRERAQIVKDELSNILSDKLNHNLYVLSIVAAIFLPLGFLTGLFGMNIGGLPGLDNPNAFLFFSLFTAGLVFLQIALFRLLKWF